MNGYFNDPNLEQGFANLVDALGYNPELEARGAHARAQQAADERLELTPEVAEALARRRAQALAGKVYRRPVAPATGGSAGAAGGADGGPYSELGKLFLHGGQRMLGRKR